MRRTFNGCEILQVTPGQCPACGARSVFSVLVTESADAGDRTPLRAFYRCNRTPLSRRYYYHDCACTDGEQANACAEGGHYEYRNIRT
jgi:hypothetical protein